MPKLESELDRLAAETNFSGVVRVDRDGQVELGKAYGFAHRGYEIPNQLETRLAIASGAKGFTALTVVSLIEDGAIDLATTARSVLGADLALIDDAVTVEHLLAHRSGIGDYLDEDNDLDLNDYLMPGSAHALAETEQFLDWLDGHPTKFKPNERFAYCNGGYVVLALIVERASGIPFHDLVMEKVCDPAGMKDTAFLRSDELLGRTALGYLNPIGARTNVFHLPVRGSGDGGIYTTVADMRSLWTAFLSGRIVSDEWVKEMIRPRSEGEGGWHYGLGFWLQPFTNAPALEGSDTGVSFRSVHDPSRDLTYTVISNTTEGAWPVTKLLAESLT